MGLNCPDCGNQVSDSAPACPNCGSPFSRPQAQAAPPAPLASPGGAGLPVEHNELRYLPCVAPAMRRILLPLLEGAALLPVTAGAAYVGVAIAGGSSPPIHLALVVTGSIGLIAGWYAVFRRAELSRRGAHLLAIGVLSGLLAVAGLFALTVVPILVGTKTSSDAASLVALLFVVYGAPVLVAIAEWPRIRRGLREISLADALAPRMRGMRYRGS